MYSLLSVIISPINIRQFIANQQIKTAFATNDIIFNIIYWKISFFLNSQKLCTCSYIESFFSSKFQTPSQDIALTFCIVYLIFNICF